MVSLLKPKLGFNRSSHSLNQTQRQLEYSLAAEPISILLVHGSPRSINEYLLEDLPEQYVKELLLEANTDILFCGHTHKPYHRLIHTSGM